jgi:alpha-L-rhamnosidase
MRAPRSFALILAMLALAFCLPATAARKPDLRVVDLRCEYDLDPLGIDTPAPRLSWKFESSTRGQHQTAYQVMVASTPERLAAGKADLWDSGKVLTGNSLHIPYAGKPLRSSQQVFWKVRAWDKDRRPSEWSAPASWTMGLLNPEDWQAQWISFTTNDRPNLYFLGYHAATSDTQENTKWVQIDLGSSRAIETVILQPMDHAGKKGFGFPIRFKIQVSNDPDFLLGTTTFADHTAADYPNPGAQPVAFPIPGIQARYVRVTATKLWKRDERFVFALCELDVYSGGRNVAVGAKVTALDSVEEFGWRKLGLTDGQCGKRETPSDPQTLALRREFQVKPGLRRALVNVSGLGCYELKVNGTKVGDALFPPGWTKYDKTCLYDTYDVTALLRKGENAAGLLLGNGMYNVTGGRYKKFVGSFGPLKAIAQLRLEYEDGSVQVVGTGPDWKISPGPITFSCVYGGEDFDARLEQTGWTEPGFDEGSWAPAVVLHRGEPGTDLSGPALRGHSFASPPVRAIETISPAKITQLRPGVTVYDLGQNTAMMPRVRLKGPAGSSVRIIPAELIKEDGSVDRQSCGRGEAWWQYTFADEKPVTWFPKFYYHGARYLQVECIPAKPALAASGGGDTVDSSKVLPEVESLEGVVVHAGCDPRGEFASSSELFTRIRRLIRWAQRSNMVTVLTDCPHREKLGWLEEYHLNGPAIRYEFDLARLFTKSMNDMADSQLKNGLVPDIAPEYVQFNGGFRDSPEWGSACALVPWQQYLFEGDIELLRRYFKVMEDYVAYLGSKANNHIVSHGLGDWYDLGPNPPGYAQLTPIPLTATAFYYYDAHILSETAKLLGDTAKARKYAALADNIRDAFNREFYKPGAQPTYATGSQAGNAIALVMNLAPEADRAAILEAIILDVRNRGDALSAGDVGYRYLLRALADGGRSDVIYDMNSQSSKPGYGYQLAQGATSLTEAWNARPQSSQNHFMLGQINEWFYHDLAGIQPTLEAPGFKKIRIRPCFPEQLSWVSASYNSPYGKISSRWERNGPRTTLRVTVPPNTTAEVHLEGADPRLVTEQGKAVTKSAFVKLLTRQNGTAIYSVASGEYEFAW